MTDLAIITPSRGRPEQFAAMLDAVFTTATGEVQVLAGIDNDDPSDYLTPVLGKEYDCIAYRGDRMSLSGWTNHLAQQVLQSAHPPRYLASLGDDHRPRTLGWDRTLIDAIEAMEGPGIAYGNDLLQGANLCTAWVVSAELVRAVGWMMPPGCEHLYVDTAVFELGRAAGRIVYRPDVVIEHLHPVAGKAGWDDSYRASNSDRRYAADRAAYEAWRAERLPADVAAVRALTHTPAPGVTPCR